MRRTVYFALGMIIAVAAFAQERSGRIVGRVTDPAGLPVAGVRIRAVNVATGLTREAASGNADGAYLIPALPPGVYQLEASRDGFAPLVRAGVQVDVDQAARADLQLSLSSSAESITVTADALQVNTVNAVGGALVGRKQIEDLPLNGRNFIQLGTLVPGAVPVPSRYEVQGIQPARNGFAVNGLRTQSNSFLLDGVTNTDPNFNGYVATPPPDALEQFRIVTGTFSAEYGSSAGSTVSAITRSGTNEFHARAWNFLRNDALDARDFFARSRPPLRQNQFGGTAGGRIFRDRTFYFGYFEGLEARTGTTQNVVAPTSAERGGDFSGSAQPPRDPAAGNAPFPNARFRATACLRSRRNFCKIWFLCQTRPATVWFARRSFPPAAGNSAFASTTEFRPAIPCSAVTASTRATQKTRWAPPTSRQRATSARTIFTMR